MLKRVTLADVARAAGVHHTTVSLALRNHPRLPQKTVERLKSIAARMGYRPDPALGALVAYRNGIAERKNTQTLAYLLRLASRRDVEHDPHGSYFKGAREQAELLGYRLEKFWLDDDGVKPSQLHRILHARGIRGILIASVQPDLHALELEWNRFCVVRIGHHPTELAVPAVANNLFQVTRVAVEKVHALGFRRIGLATSDADTVKLADMIRAGFEIGCNRCAMRHRVPPVVFAVRGPDQRRTMTAQLRVWARQRRVDALLSNWDFPAAELQEIGVPNFFCLDAPANEPARCGMIQNHQLVGASALDQLTLLLKNNQFGPQEFPSLTLVDGYWRDPVLLAAAR